MASGKQQRVALVTGGMGGLGETISTKLADGGYRVCALRPGRFELALQHAFSLKDRKAGADAHAPNLSWPVSVSLVTP